MVKITVDTDEAAATLASAWETVQAARREGKPAYLTADYRARIRTVVNSEEKAYRYLLVAAAVAKATDDRIQYRALKKNDCDLDGAYAPRTTAKKVVMPWNLQNGNRLEASAYPLAGNPIQSYAELQPEASVDSPELREELYHLFCDFQDATRSGDFAPTEILHAVLNAVAELEPRRDTPEPVDLSAPYQQVITAIEAFLKESGGGERLMAVTAGYFDGCWRDDAGEFTVNLGHANAADAARGTVGDVWIESASTDGATAGVEVKHTSVGMEEVLLAKQKAVECGLERYYVVADLFTAPTAFREIAADAPLDLVLVTIEELLAWIQPLGDQHREAVLDCIGSHLRDMGASDTSLKAWEETIEMVQSDETVE